MRTTTRLHASLIERGLGAIYLIAFVVAFAAVPGPVGRARPRSSADIPPARSLPRRAELFHVRYSDRLLRVVARSWRGALRRGRSRSGERRAAPDHDADLVRTVGALPVDHEHRRHVLRLRLGVASSSRPASSRSSWATRRSRPPFRPCCLFRWIAFRVEFGAGLIKLRGDRCWRELDLHGVPPRDPAAAQPALPGSPTTLPRCCHRLEAIGNFVTQLVLPFGLFLPQPFASIAAAADDRLRSCTWS